MYKGQQLTLEGMLPQGMSVETFYIIAASLPAFLVMVVIGSAMIPRNSMSARVRALGQRQAELRGEAVDGRKRRRRRGAVVADVSKMKAVVDKFNLLKGQQIEMAQKLLVQAGWRGKDAIIVYAFFSLVGPIVGVFVGLAVMQMRVFETDSINYAMPILFAYLGLKLPILVVKRKRKKRYGALQRALSDTLDLMTICAEAGLSLSAAIKRVAGELELPYPVMAEELSLTSLEMGFLPDRNKALVNLSDRSQIEEIRGIVNVLIQTEKYGTPIAQAMRVLAAEFREQRMLRAENKAARLPAIMTVPMIVCILPTLFIMIISPAAIRIMDAK